MKQMLIISVLCCCCSCFYTARVSPEAEVPEGYVIPDKVYEPGIYTPSDEWYSHKRYDGVKMRQYLAQLTVKHNDGDIVQVDGLKWQLSQSTWKPFQNPPMPKLADGGDRQEHFKAYAEWINSHPHFGYPPLPPVGR